MAAVNPPVETSKKRKNKKLKGMFSRALKDLTDVAPQYHYSQPKVGMGLSQF